VTTPITYANWPGRTETTAEKRQKLEQQIERLEDDIAWRIANNIGHAYQDAWLTVLEHKLAGLEKAK